WPRGCVSPSIAQKKMRDLVSRVGDFLRRDKAALALYAVLMVVSLLPQSLHPVDTLAYVGDPVEVAYTLAWTVRQLPHGLAALAASNILYPNPRPWLLGPHRILPALAGAPVLLATRNPVLGAHVALALPTLPADMAGRA